MLRRRIEGVRLVWMDGCMRLRDGNVPMAVVLLHDDQVTIPFFSSLVALARRESLRLL